MPSPILAVTSIAAALTIGLLHSFLECVRPSLQEYHHLDDGACKRLTRIYMLLSVPLLIFAGWLCDSVGFALVLFFGSLGLGVGVALLTQTQKALAWAILMIAAAGACVTVAGLAIMADGFLPDRGNSAALNLGFAFIGLSALSTPVVLPWLIRSIGLRRALVLVALLCLGPAICTILVPTSVFGPSPDKQALPLEEVLADARLWMIVIPTFLYFALDRSLDVWTKPFLGELGYNGRSVARLVLGFWLALLLARVCFAFTIRPGFEVWVLLVLLIVSAMVMGNLAGAYAPSSGYAGLWLVGACYGPLMPGFLGVLLSLDPSRRMPTTVLGGLFALGFLSDIVVEPALVAFAKNRPARISMRIPMILALVMAAPLIMLAVIRFSR